MTPTPNIRYHLTPTKEGLHWYLQGSAVALANMEAPVSIAFDAIGAWIEMARALLEDDGTLGEWIQKTVDNVVESLAMSDNKLLANYSKLLRREFQKRIAECN